MVVENKPIDTMIDIIVPTILIATLFVLNGVILFYIFKQRKSIVYEEYPAEVASSSNCSNQSEEQCTASIEMGKVQNAAY